MSSKLPGLLFVLMFVATSCGVDDADVRDAAEPVADANAGTGETSDDNWGLDADERVAGLSDAQIRRICEDVEQYPPETCGTDPETGEPFIVEATTNPEACEEGLRTLRDNESCLRALDVAREWNATPCERHEMSPAVCPERDACTNYSLDECPQHPEVCRIETGRQWNAEAECYEEADAHCTPLYGTCLNAIVTATAPDGSCWLLGGQCAAPKGWTFEHGDRSCPYDYDIQLACDE